MKAFLPILAIGLFLAPVAPAADVAVRIALSFLGEDADFSAHLYERRAAVAFAGRLQEGLPPPPCDTNLAASLLCDHLLLSGAVKRAERFMRTQEDAGEISWEIPAKEFGSFARSWDEVFATLSSPENFSSPFFNPARAMEVAPAGEQAALRGEFVRRVLRRYGLPCARFWSDGIPIGYSPRLAGALRTGFLEHATGHDLMLLLGELPGDPRIIAELAGRFERLGMRKAAQWLASRGFMSFIDYAASSRCREIVARSDSFVMSSFEGGFPYERLQPLTSAADFRGTPLAVYDAWRRPFPGGSPIAPGPSDPHFARGVEALRSEKPDVEAAYGEFLESIAARISFAACVFAGECAFRLEKYPESAMLCWQALCIHGAAKHDVPWFYLLRVASRLQNDEALGYCREMLAKQKPGSEMRQVLAEEGIEVEDVRK